MVLAFSAMEKTCTRNAWGEKKSQYFFILELKHLKSLGNLQYGKYVDFGGSFRGVCCTFFKKKKKTTMEKHFSRGQVSKSLSALSDTSSGYSRYHQEICHIYSLLLWIYSQGVISFQAHQKQLQPLCIFRSLDCRGSTRLTFHLLALNYFASTHSSSKSSCVGCPVSAHSYPLPACPAPSPIFSGHSKHCSWKFSVRLILHGFCFLYCFTVLKEKKKKNGGVGWMAFLIPQFPWVLS